MSNKLECSFRDPSGFIFKKDGVLYRQINYSYKENYDYFKSSGLYNELIELDLLVPHEEVIVDCLDGDGYVIIKPVELPVISYPYEWSFSQLKEAALLTLNIQQKALSKGLSLKDASSYNVQLYNGKPIFIDTLSFEILQSNQPWVAYKQFCQHFLAPLALMAKTEITLNQLLKTNIDGIPLGLASKLLPLRSTCHRCSRACSSGSPRRTSIPRASASSTTSSRTSSRPSWPCSSRWPGCPSSPLRWGPPASRPWCSS